ncbi:MAG: PD-(D/E)XK nuclease family protein [Steroidobacteraceae bacterium]
MDTQLYDLLTNNATVLTASRHLAHALRQEYAQQAQAHGLQVWPTPRILPWSTYLHTACQRLRNDPIQVPRLLSDLQALTLWERIIAASDRGQDLLNPAQAARNVQRSWQRLHQYLIPLRKVGAYPNEEAQAFNEWTQQFIVETQQRHWLDSTRFAEHLYNQQFQPDTSLVVYGFDQLTPDMQRLLRGWQERGAIVHQPELVSLKATTSTVALRDSDAELRAAASWARQQVESGKSRVAVVVPQLAAQTALVQRRFIEVFAPAQRSIHQILEPSAFRVVATPALSSYALIHHALLLLQLMRGRVDVLLVGQLLRSPFIHGYETEMAARALADVTARNERREQWSCNELERLALANQCEQLAACMQATANYLREHQDSVLPSQWTERVTQLLKLSGWPFGRALDSSEQQTLNKFQQTLAALSALDELLAKVDFNTAINTLRTACNTERFAPESLDQAVTVIDADSIAGMQFDALWVMGMHAGDWAPAPEPDPFLPIELQLEYGLPDASAEHCLQRTKHKLSRLVNSANQVILSWPQHDDDAELRPSSLLSAWPAVELEAVTQSTTRPLGKLLFASRPALESFVDDHAPSQVSGAVKGGSRILELQSRCAFRAQAELRLYAAAMPSVSPAIEATERGVLVHRVLTEIWQQLKGSAGLQQYCQTGDAEAELKPELHIMVRGIADRIAQQVIPGGTVHRRRLAALETELCVQWIMALLQVEAHRLPFRVQTAEQSESYELSGMKIKIQLDRVDALSDGSVLLIDYKTGSNNTCGDWLDRTPGRPRSPQLPLYALAHRQQLAGIAFAVMAPGTAEFRGLADTDSIATGIADYAQQKPSAKLSGIDTWDELVHHWDGVLNTLAQQYLSGMAQVDPLPGECTYCHLNGFCRVHEIREFSGIDTDTTLRDAGGGDE